MLVMKVRLKFVKDFMTLSQLQELVFLRILD